MQAEHIARSKKFVKKLTIKITAFMTLHPPVQYTAFSLSPLLFLYNYHKLGWITHIPPEGYRYF